MASSRSVTLLSERTRRRRHARLAPTTRSGWRRRRSPAKALRAAYQPRTQTLVISGRVLALRKPRPGVKVSLFADWHGGPPDTFTLSGFKDQKTRSDGTFHLSEPRNRILQPNQTAKLEIHAFVDAITGPCTAPAAAPGGCASDTLSPPITPLDGITVNIPPTPPKRS